VQQGPGEVIAVRALHRLKGFPVVGGRTLPYATGKSMEKDKRISRTSLRASWWVEERPSKIGCIITQMQNAEI